MRRIYLITSLLAGLLLLASCNEFKKAYEETFADEEEVQNNVGDIFNDIFEETDAGKKRIENNLINEYIALLDRLFAGLEEHKLNNLKEMVRNDIVDNYNTEISLLFLPHKLNEIQDELYSFLETDEVMLYNSTIFVENNRVRMQAINPNNSSEVDWYWYESKTGKWRKEDPVKLSKRDLDNLSDNIRPLSTFEISTAHNIFIEALKRGAEIEGIELPKSITYYHHNHRQYWSLRIDGARADYSVEADSDGNITEFEMR